MVPDYTVHLSHNVISEHTQVHNVEGGCGTEVRGKGGDIPREAVKADSLPVLWSRTYRAFNDGA